MDTSKIVLAAVAVVAGLYGFYHFEQSPAVVRVICVLAGVVVAVASMWTTVQGSRFRAFALQSIDETRKVVWPSRKETLQTTGIVFAFCVVSAIFLWIVDASLLYLVQLLMGRTE
ncbi:MAG: preprotein translocase subunit SecE [Proteobacteria bacterium]|nr:preprotein translocase subunit SecE [Pseudomonadota bacterium]